MRDNEFIFYRDRIFNGYLAAIKFGDKVFVGASKCNERDMFCKKIGRDIAKGRALHIADSKSPEQIKMTAVFDIAEFEGKVPCLCRNVEIWSATASTIGHVIVLRNKGERR